MNFYLLYESNSTLRTFIAALELQFHIFVPRGKIVQNIKFLSIRQTSDLISKLYSTHQHESRDMLSFQNKAPNTKLLQFHENRDNLTYLKKCDFKRKLIFQIQGHHWIRDVQTSLGVASVPDSPIDPARKTR